MGVGHAWPRASVAGRIWVITAHRMSVRRGICSVGRCRTIGCGTVSSAPVHGTAKSGSTGDAGKGERRQWSANDVDEYGCATIGTGQVSLKDINVETRQVSYERP